MRAEPTIPDIPAGRVLTLGKEDWRCGERPLTLGSSNCAPTCRATTTTSGSGSSARRSAPTARHTAGWAPWYGSPRCTPPLPDHPRPRSSRRDGQPPGCGPDDVGAVSKAPPVRGPGAAKRSESAARSGCSTASASAAASSSPSSAPSPYAVVEGRVAQHPRAAAACCSRPVAAVDARRGPQLGPGWPAPRRTAGPRSAGRRPSAQRTAIAFSVSQARPW